MFDRENSGCAIVENGKLLTLHRIERNHLEIPGGGVEPGETLAQAAARETKEEIGIEVEVGKYLGYIDFEVNGKRIRSHNFAGKIPMGKTPKVNEPEIFNELVWVEMKEWKKYPCAPNTKIFCENYTKTGKLELPTSTQK